MANAFYDKGKEKLISGGAATGTTSGSSIKLDTDTIKAALLSSSYVPNLSTHEFYSEISTYLLNTPKTLAGKTYSQGVFDADDITYTAVTAGATAKYVALFKDTGTASTSPLLALFDTITGFPVATNGADIVIVWPSDGNKIFAL